MKIVTATATAIPMTMHDAEDNNRDHYDDDDEDENDDDNDDDVCARHKQRQHRTNGWRKEQRRQCDCAYDTSRANASPQRTLRGNVCARGARPVNTSAHDAGTRRTTVQDARAGNAFVYTSSQARAQDTGAHKTQSPATRRTGREGRQHVCTGHKRAHNVCTSQSPATCLQKTEATRLRMTQSAKHVCAGQTVRATRLHIRHTCTFNPSAQVTSAGNASADDGSTGNTSAQGTHCETSWCVASSAAGERAARATHVRTRHKLMRDVGSTCTQKLTTHKTAKETRQAERRHVSSETKAQDTGARQTQAQTERRRGREHRKHVCSRRARGQPVCA